MLNLKLIGYWRSSYEPNWPDPAWFVDELLTKSEISMTVEYLKQGTYLPYAAGGYSWCRFCCDDMRLGNREQTDGKFLWPEKLWHYVECHNVRLPEEFVNEVIKNEQIPVLQETKLLPPNTLTIDSQWWKNQKGWNQKASSFLTPYSKGILQIQFAEHLDLLTKVKYLKTLDAFSNYSYPELKDLTLQNQRILSIVSNSDYYRKSKKSQVDGIEVTFIE